MLDGLTSAVAVNRFGLGARPGELGAVGGGARDWLRAQLKDAPPQINDAQLQASSDILASALDLRREIRTSRRVIADWPGLSARALFQGRDLMPTLDVRSVLKCVLQEDLRIPSRALDTVFPDSAAVKPLSNLFRA